MLRPLYQETILPNICYVGGGSEISYWLELKKCFDESDLCFPILLNRNSVLLVKKKQFDKLSKVNTSVNELFLNQNNLIASKTFLLGMAILLILIRCLKSSLASFSFKAFSSSTGITLLIMIFENFSENKLF